MTFIKIDATPSGMNKLEILSHKNIYKKYKEMCPILQKSYATITVIK